MLGKFQLQGKSQFSRNLPEKGKIDYSREDQREEFKFNSEKYIKNWLREHNHAESSHNTGKEKSKKTIIKKCWEFF